MSSLPIESVVEDLQGSCDSFDPTEYSDDDLEYLDSVIFNCNTCGWWYDIGDLSETCSDELTCQDCEEEENE